MGNGCKFTKSIFELFMSKYPIIESFLDLIYFLFLIKYSYQDLVFLKMLQRIKPFLF